ncbi:MAG: alpha/beta hydrolase [Haliea sp.]|uniref:alpha/beta hydrolase n=1 Tax=Haliea sp. TaxID=1932666 RepID=UPI0032EB56C8
MSANSLAGAAGLSTAVRLHALQSRGLATFIRSEHQLLRRYWDHWLARMENRVIERVLLGRIKRCFTHLDDPRQLEVMLHRMREAYLSGKASTLQMSPPRVGKLNPVADIPAQAAWLRGEKQHPGLLIYTAGGGFMLPPSTAQIACAKRLAELAETDAVLNYHAMSPEAPYPAAIDDTVALYIWALDQYGPGNIVLAADTAGASVTMGALLTLRELGYCLPAAVQLFSPWNDLSLSGWSYITKSASADSPFRMETAAFCVRAYLGSTPVTEPKASAIYADLAALPPIAIHTSRYDMHFDDALRVVEKISDAGGHAEIRYWDSPRHHLERFASDEATKSLTVAAAFLARHLNVRGVG